MLPRSTTMRQSAVNARVDLIGTFPYIACLESVRTIRRPERLWGKFMTTFSPLE
jgi:hypothetical protein